MDQDTLRLVAEAKDEGLQRREQEFRFKKDKYVAVIDDALFPFSNLKFSFSKGFYKKDKKFGLLRNEDEYMNLNLESTIKSESDGRCRICSSCA